MAMEKMMPHNLEAERGVLGSILIDPDAIVLVADFLASDDFYRETHQRIYDAMLRLYERHQPPDFITVCDALDRKDALDDVGGPGYITSLVNDVPTSSHVEHYGHIVSKAAVNRRIIAAGQRIVEAGFHEEDDALQQAEELIYGIGNRDIHEEFDSASSIFTEFFTQLETMDNASAIVGIPSGFTVLDNMTRGFQRSDLIVLAGRPGMGKTSMALSLARNAAMDYQCGVALFSLEMSKRQLIQRLAGMEAGIDVQRVFTKQLSEVEMERLIHVAGAITDAPLWIDDTPGITISAFRSKLRRLMAKERIDLVVVDYLQLLHATIDGKRIKEREHEIAEVARELKNIAREFDVPVIALAQLSRAVENRADKRPQLSDLRESGEIEQAADVITFLYRDGYYNPESNRPGTCDILIAKHRNGPMGEVVLKFEASQTKFSNL